MRLLNMLKKDFEITPKEDYQTILPIGIVALAAIMLLGAIPIWWSSIKGFLAYGSDVGIANYVIIRNMGLFVVGLFGLGLAGWRAKSMSRQALVAEQGHITDRIIKATENLGSNKSLVRIGAIYTLWRTAIDSNRMADKTHILDVLCAFIRTPTADEHTPPEGSLREDVRTALVLITLHRDELNLSSQYAPDLANADLSDAFIQDADLEGADLSHAILTNASFPNGNFRSAYFHSAIMHNTGFDGADLSNATLCFADMEDAYAEESVCFNTRFLETNLAKSTFVGASMEKASFEEAVFTSANFQDADLRGANFNSAYVLDVDMSGAKLKGASFEDALLTNTIIFTDEVEASSLSRKQLNSMLIRHNLNNEQG
ncbi:pentapeptide repeat-containing protein [Pseudodesulfovibrio sediminis]|uniref:Pentapeptide repeat-containing protein n=1 Tax=Pseudodesulfovibrio sediminis TaxID=2810563 RepID=A0ABM7P2L6_9BACT|nr:pentapeptide repeat-containing protein [Pseudodesulfovibrio sediminis]BCS87124.1 hypothetical protein PSDVSF_03660 [Pseudodesulfovibrio sediminis]